MLINVFSTQRTGSTWWAYYQLTQLRKKIPQTTLLNEVFNQLEYFTLRPNDEYVGPHSEYFFGCFWRAPNEECSKIVRNFSEMSKEENVNRFDRWIKYIRLSEYPIVCHTHLSPIVDEKYLSQLNDMGDKNYVVYRENILDQLASMAIATYTGLWKTYLPNTVGSKYDYSIISGQVLNSVVWLHALISTAPTMISTHIKNAEVISYESMPFDQTLYGMPRKQNQSSFSRLCEQDQQIIIKIKEHSNGTDSSIG